MRNVNRGFTLVEMFTVVALIALCSAFTIPVIYRDQHFQEVGGAVKKAGEIAAAIDAARSMGVVSSYNGTLRGFITANNSDVDDFMPTIKSTVPVHGQDPRDLYNVKVGDYSVEVSLSFTGTEYTDYQFPSSYRRVVTQTTNGTTATVVTWTVGPTITDGIGIAYMINNYINNED